MVSDEDHIRDPGPVDHVRVGRECVDAVDPVDQASVWWCVDRCPHGGVVTPADEDGVGPGELAGVAFADRSVRPPGGVAQAVGDQRQSLLTARPWVPSLRVEDAQVDIVAAGEVGDDGLRVLRIASRYDKQTMPTIRPQAGPTGSGRNHAIALAGASVGAQARFRVGGAKNLKDLRLPESCQELVGIRDERAGGAVGMQFVVEQRLDDMDDEPGCLLDPTMLSSSLARASTARIRSWSSGCTASPRLIPTVISLSRSRSATASSWLSSSADRHTVSAASNDWFSRRSWTILGACGTNARSSDCVGAATTLRQATRMLSTLAPLTPLLTILVSVAAGPPRPAIRDNAKDPTSGIIASGLTRAALRAARTADASAATTASTLRAHARSHGSYLTSSHVRVDALERVETPYERARCASRF